MFEPPKWMQPQTQNKTLSLEQLKEKRRKLVELQKIRKLQEQSKKLDEQLNAQTRKDREAKIRAMKTTVNAGINIIKAGRKKIGDYERKRSQAKPIIGNYKKKSIYD